MSYILAIESDPRQAAALSHVVKDRVPGAQLTVVDSKDGALASIQKKAPDLILVTALFSPREEEELIAHLRTLEGAEHLQTLTIPLLAAFDDGGGKSRRGLFGFKKKKADDVPTQGCDPVVFAEQIVGYLKTATEMKANAEAAKIAAERAAQRAAETAAKMPAAPVAEPVVEPIYQPFEAPAEPVTASYAEPVVAYAAEPVSTPEPEPVIAPAPEPVVAQPREQPLVGYSVNSLGELLSKEAAVESSAPVPDSTPAPEPQIFGSVLFAKVKPKREIKPFTEATPVHEEAPARGVPMVDELPIAVDAPAIVTPPIDAPPPLEVPVAAAPVEEVRAYTPAPVPDPPVVEVPPPVVREVAFQPSEPLVAFSMPQPSPAPEPASPVRLVQRLPPLAMWARRLQDAEAIHVGNNGHSSNGNDEGPLAVLRIPPAIATITYPTGCRIRRVIAKSLG